MAEGPHAEVRDDELGRQVRLHGLGVVGGKFAFGDMKQMATNGKKWQKMAKNGSKCFAGKFGHTITVTKTITTYCGAVFDVKDGRPCSL